MFFVAKAVVHLIKYGAPHTGWFDGQDLVSYLYTNHLWCIIIFCTLPYPSLLFHGHQFVVPHPSLLLVVSATFIAGARTVNFLARLVAGTNKKFVFSRFVCLIASRGCLKFSSLHELPSRRIWLSSSNPFEITFWPLVHNFNHSRCISWILCDSAYFTFVFVWLGNFINDR